MIFNVRYTLKLPKEMLFKYTDIMAPLHLLIQTLVEWSVGGVTIFII